MNPRFPEAHLKDGDLFLLAFPPTGEPGPLPPHLAGCRACARRFAEWERAAREIAGRPESSAADFEQAVMARIRALPAARGRRGRAWATALVAAAALFAAFWPRSLPPGPSPAPAGAGMNARDLADDALLREVSRVVDGEDGAAWDRIAPLPAETEGKS